MKVILCTPYIQSPEYAQGGLVVWGANIVNYYKNSSFSNIELVPVSFDRKTYANSHNSNIGRFFNGIKELWQSTFLSLKLLKNDNVDAIHICTSIHFSLLKDFILLKAAQHYKVRSYIHFHCGRIPIVLNNNDWEHKLFKKVMNLATKGVTMDLKSYDALKKCGFENVVNLANPLSLLITDQIVEKRNTITKVPNRIAFVGHVIRLKGIFELIESCCKLGASDLHIIGKVLPEDKIEIDKLLSNYNTDGKWITWLGEISHEQVINELLAAEIFALPTYTEGFPNVILEAMACGCAIVTTNVGAIPEMLDIKNQPCGICVEPQNEKSFFEALQSIYNKPKQIAHYSKYASMRVNEQYVISKIWNQMLNIWKN